MFDNKQSAFCQDCYNSLINTEMNFCPEACNGVIFPNSKTLLTAHLIYAIFC